MDCRNVKRKQVKSLKTQARALNTAILFVVYLIFSSGGSVFIPKYSGILSGSAPVWAISWRSSAFSSVTLGAYFGSSIRFLVSCGLFFRLYSSALYRSGLSSPLGYPMSVVALFDRSFSVDVKSCVVVFTLSL